MASDHTLKFRNKNLRNWQPAFLAALARTGLVSQSARQVGVNPKTAYHARDLRNRSGQDLARAQRFAQAWDLALQEAAEAVEMEVRKRALEGTQRSRSIYHKGRLVGTETVNLYSDQLLIFLLKSLIPEKYGAHPRQSPKPVSAPPRDLVAEVDEITRIRWAESLPLIEELLAKQAASTASADSATGPNPANSHE
jgi:hypothetical protein